MWGHADGARNGTATKPQGWALLQPVRPAKRKTEGAQPLTNQPRKLARVTRPVAAVSEPHVSEDAWQGHGCPVWASCAPAAAAQPSPRLAVPARPHGVPQRWSTRQLSDPSRVLQTPTQPPWCGARSSHTLQLRGCLGTKRGLRLADQSRWTGSRLKRKLEKNVLHLFFRSSLK